jgi:hypothetical protein
MEASRIQSELKHLEMNGVTLSIEEKIQLDLSFQTLSNDLPQHATSLFFWGKIRGKSFIHACNQSNKTR